MTMTGGEFEFDCPDCENHIIVVGFVPTPPPTRCASCQWILDYIPEHERAEVRALLNRDR